MYYTTNQVQNASADFENCLVIPSMLTDFVNTGTSVEATKGGTQSPFSIHLVSHQLYTYIRGRKISFRYLLS